MCSSYLRSPGQMRHCRPDYKAEIKLSRTISHGLFTAVCIRYMHCTCKRTFCCIQESFHGIHEYTPCVVLSWSTQWNCAVQFKICQNRASVIESNWTMMQLTMPLALLQSVKICHIKLRRSVPAIPNTQLEYIMCCLFGWRTEVSTGTIGQMKSQTFT